jgi:hypothetical protein
MGERMEDEVRERDRRRQARRAAERSALRSAADVALAATVKLGCGSYDRACVLPRLIAIDPRDLAAGSPDLARRIIARLECALRAERQRGRAGHWTYDLNRHIALRQALLAERADAPTDRSAAYDEKPPGANRAV